jgi:hypothetical protein
MRSSPVALPSRSRLREQGRSLAWLARQTQTPPPTVYSKTLYSWGVTAPKYAELSRVAGVLDVPLAYLGSYYLGDGGDCAWSVTLRRQ